MLLFQQMEYGLKFLIAKGKIEGCISEIKGNLEHRAEDIYKRTMGQLVGQYLENTYSEENEEHPEEPREAYFSLTLMLNNDAASYEAKKQTFASLVAERNDLIHHLIPRLNSDSAESWIKVERYLDNQREKLLPELDQLMTIVNRFQEILKVLEGFLASDEGKRAFKSSWQQSRLALLLGEIADQDARHDGWTLLSIAGKLVWQDAPEEMATLNSRYGHKSLKSLLLATELFDVAEEPTVKGGTRVLYRRKPVKISQPGNQL